MIKIYDSGFTNTLWNIIKAVSLKALKAITPVNFLYISQDKLNDINQDNLKFTGDSKVNSVQLFNINKAINTVKLNLVETIELSLEVTQSDITTVISNGLNQYRVSFTVPESFDGRNCFPYVRVNTDIEYNTGATVLSDMLSTINDAGDAEAVGIEVFLQPDKIDFLFYFGSDTSAIDIKDYTVVAELWRNK